MKIRISETTRRRCLCGVVVALVAAGGRGRAMQLPALGARSGPAPAGTALIVGQVTEAGTTRPVAGVTVAAVGAPPGMATGGVGDAIPMDRMMSMDLSSVMAGIQQTLTDAQGRFAFTGLPGGTYSLQATKPGWSTGGYGQLRPDSSPVPLVLADGEAAGNVVLPLWKFSAVGGTIVDESNDPIVGLGVRALRRTWQAGRPRLVTAGIAQTDDRGMYRLSSLSPGDYVMVIPQTIVTSPAGGSGPPADLGAIQAMVAGRGASADPAALMSMLTSLGSSASGGIRVGDWVMQTSGMGGRIVPPVIGASGRMLAYQTTFFPASNTASQAAIVTLGSGDDRSGVDFQLKPTIVTSVSGSVTGPDGPVASVAVRLIPSGAEDLSSDAGFEVGITTTNGSGAFMFLAVPPGQYSLRVLRIPPIPATPPVARPDIGVIQNASGGMATSIGSLTMDMVMPAAPAIPTAPTLWASMPVAVGDTDVVGLPVPLRPGFRVSGRLAFDGTGTPPALTQFRRIPILLDRAGPTGGVPGAAAALNGARGEGGQFDDSGQFSSYGLVPGKYFVRVPFSVGGWTLKSATLGGRDLADLPLTIEDSDVSGIVLTFSDRTAELSGSVQNDQGRPDAEASVVVFPSDSSAWVDFGSSPRRIRSTRTGKDGRYKVTGLPPGEYVTVAVRGDAGMDWQNPSFLETVARGGTKITIADGEKKVQDLRTSR